ncbi:MAG TPA: hypothetical protein VGQ80_10005, partial [Acidimicrobiia bacterium]|nr:hypothetical protein [Acidimicrobiia bacterium]
TTALVWDLTGHAGHPPRSRLSQRELEALAADLAGPNAGRAYRAVWALAAAVAAAIAFLLPREPEVAPSLPSLADSHAARASITGDPLSQLAPIAVPVSFGP